MNKSDFSQAKRQRGFSLIELVMALSIGSILISVAIPNLKVVVQNNRIQSQIGDFMSDLNLARSEAIKQGRRVTICKSANGSSCTTSNGWDQGWIVFVENNGNGLLDDGEIVLRVHSSLSGGNTMSSIGNIDNYISYVANGFSRTNNNVIQTGSIALCDSRQDDTEARAVRINATGRPLLSNVSESPQTCAS